MSEATRAEVCAVACAELFRDAGEIMASAMSTMSSVGARLARLTFSPRPRALGRRGLAHGGYPGYRCSLADRGLDAVPQGIRRGGLRPSPCRHGRQPDRSLRQSEPLGVRPLAAPHPADVRGTRRPGQHDQPRHLVLGGQPHGTRVRELSRRGLRCRLRQRSIRRTRPTSTWACSASFRTWASSTSTARITRCAP